MSDKQQLFIIRVLILVFILSSVLIAVLQYKKNIIYIAQLMGISWGALAGSFLAPFLFGLFWKKITRAAVWCNFVFSTVFMSFVFMINSGIITQPSWFPKIIANGINAGAFAVIAGFVIVPIISLLTKPPKQEIVDDCFSCFSENNGENNKEAVQ